jgi:hypothetical protein
VLNQLAEVTMTPSAKDGKSLLSVQLEDETQKWLSVQRCVVRKKAMPVKADLKSVPEVQESSSNKAPPYLHDALWHLHDLVSYQSDCPSSSICPSPAPHS